MPWYTNTDRFHADFGVDEWHGHNAFLTALGRFETWEESPPGYPQSPPHRSWSWHDTYAAGAGRADYGAVPF